MIRLASPIGLSQSKHSFISIASSFTLPDLFHFSHNYFLPNVSITLCLIILIARVSLGVASLSEPMTDGAVRIASPWYLAYRSWRRGLHCSSTRSEELGCVQQRKVVLKAAAQPREENAVAKLNAFPAESHRFIVAEFMVWRVVRRLKKVERSCNNRPWEDCSQARRR